MSGQQRARKLTVEQAAELANCHKETLRRAIRRRELLATREATKRGRGYVVLATDLNDFLEKRRFG